MKELGATQPRNKGEPKMLKMSQYQVSVAAEAFATMLFAQVGLDVSVQYGANQPEYDLIVAKGDQLFKVSVKGSQNGGWGLIQSYKKGRTYHEAIDNWAHHHKSKNVVYCLIQFKGVQLGDSPRAYLATVLEIAEQLKTQRSGHGYTSLKENYHWARGVAKGGKDLIPSSWKFSETRAHNLLHTSG
ncbi:MAG: hypothetical protein WA102_07455 [Candidatus Methanoperedens sp.]